MEGKTLKDLFGTNGFGFADLPQKISGKLVSKILAKKMECDCHVCWPGKCSYKNTDPVSRRCWKNYRRTQWRLQLPFCYDSSETY